MRENSSNLKEGKNKAPHICPVPWYLFRLQSGRCSKFTWVNVDRRSLGISLAPLLRKRIFDMAAIAAFELKRLL